jgi:hypothetical protein
VGSVVGSGSEGCVLGSSLPVVDALGVGSGFDPDGSVSGVDAVGRGVIVEVAVGAVTSGPAALITGALGASGSVALGVDAAVGTGALESIEGDEAAGGVMGMDAVLVSDAGVVVALGVEFSGVEPHAVRPALPSTPPSTLLNSRRWIEPRLRDVHKGMQLMVGSAPPSRSSAACVYQHDP